MKYIEYNKDNYIQWEKIYFSYNEVKDREDLPDWFKEYLNHVGEKYITNTLKKIFELKGMSETNEDYYYYGIDDKGNELFETCVEKITRL